MITYVHGSVFEQQVEALVNAVNCVGVMGTGVALEFKKRHPAMFEDYVERCGRKLVQPGQPYLYEDRAIKIINLPTKNHWRHPSKIQWIESGLIGLRALCEANAIQSIALPKLGCGNGKLAWSDVDPLFEQYLSLVDFNVIVCLDAGGESRAHKKSEREVGRRVEKNESGR